MELRHLRYFAAVAVHGSFNRAAQNLHLTQPALSRQVKDLEDELGVSLFVRGNNAVTLTEAGELFYDEAHDLLARADRAIQRVRGAARKAVLRIGHGPSFTTGIMPQALEKFRAAAPEVRVDLLDLSSREMEELGRKGRLDLVVAPDAVEIPGFEWTELRETSPVLVMPRRHPLAKLKKVPPARLREVPLGGLGRENFPEYLPRVRAMLKPHGVTPRFAALDTHGTSTLFSTLEAHNLAAVLADGTACIMPRGLVSRPFSPSLGVTAVRVGIPTGQSSPHAQAFARLLRETAASSRKRFA